MQIIAFITFCFNLTPRISNVATIRIVSCSRTGSFDYPETTDFGSSQCRRNTADRTTTDSDRVPSCHSIDLDRAAAHFD